MPPLRKKKVLHRRKHKTKRVTVKTKTPRGISLPEPILLNESIKNNQRPIFCKKDATGVERLLCPYNTFRIKRPTYPRKKRMSWDASSYGYGQGISPKERNYLVCSCQRKALRYSLLKAQAAHAIKHKKIFTVSGQCPFVRKALVSRGWVEKIPAARMDVTAIRSKQFSDDEIDVHLERLFLSTLVEKASPTFMWNARDDFDPSKDTHQPSNALYNRLRQEALWTTKQGLCTALQNYQWYHVDGLAEVACPRTHISFSEEDREEFLDDYRLTACTSLLKWLLSMVANKRNVNNLSGTISLDVIVFALNHCKEYLITKHNEDIDAQTPSNVTTGQWDTFFKKYYTLMTRKDMFEMDTENMLPGYVEYGKFLLKEIYTLRPQLSCEGCHNIWIIKPTHWSRGRGIRMASKLGVLTDLLKQGKYVFQKYIEEPLLIHETKFDIRQYYIVSNTVPLEIWLYKDCYLKFSSQKYSLNNFHESIHLTNHAVQKKYTNCHDRHPELPQSNMWALATYKEYLRERNKEYIWDKVIYPGMRKAILGTMLCCQETIANNKNRFELYGCDFILDKDHKPWLIEINASPDLNATTDVTANICSAVVEDLVKVMVDRLENPNACTGNFECIYRQMSFPAYIGKLGLDFVVQGRALKHSYFCKGSQPSEHNDVVYIPHDLKTLMKKLKKESSIMLKPKKSSLSSKYSSSTSLSGKGKPTPPLQVKSQQNSSIIIKSAIENTAHPVSDFLDRLTVNHSDSSTNQEKSSLSFSSSNNFRFSQIKNYSDELNSDSNSKLDLLAQKASKSDTSLSSKALAPRSANLKRNEELDMPLKQNGDKVTRSPVSNSPRRKNCDRVVDLNFGDHPTKNQKRDRNGKTTAKPKDHKGKNGNFSDVLAATNNLFLFLKQKEQEYNT